MAGFILVIAIFSVAAFIIDLKLGSTKELIENLQHQSNRMQQISQLESNMLAQVSAVRGYLYYKNDSFKDEAEQYIQANLNSLDELINSATISNDKEKYIEIKKLQEQYGDLVVNKLLPLARSGQELEANEIANNQGVPLANLIKKMLKETKEERSARLEQATKDSINLLDFVLSLSKIATLLAIILGLGISIYLARAISNPIKLVVSRASKIAEGDLTDSEIDIKTKDEVGQLGKAFNLMLSMLKDIASELQEKANSLASSSNQLSAGSENVAAAATETAATMTEFAASIEQITDHVQQVAIATETTTKAANEGTKKVAVVAEQFSENMRVSKEVGHTVGLLDQKAKEISHIIDLISGIADQTNLLALNAAIEAARAGDQGRGFAVVADEVRKLAEKSAGSAKQINEIILGIQLETQKAVIEMNNTALVVDNINISLEDLESSFQHIASSVHELASGVEEVASATEQISAGVQNIAASTEEQTATMEEVASTAQGLNKMAEELKNQAQRFKLTAS